MRVEDALVYLLALASGVVLFLGLARALDNPHPSRLGRRARAVARAIRPPASAPEPVSLGPSGRAPLYPDPGPVGAAEPFAAAPESSDGIKVVSHQSDLKHQKIEDVRTDQALSPNTPEPSPVGSGAGLEEQVAALFARREYAQARGLIEEALASETLAAARRKALREMLWTSVTGEIGRLAGQALEPGRGGHDALGALAQAEAVASAVSPEALSARKREDLNRRLWWGYMKLGVQRTEAGDFEAALEPLSHAFSLVAGDPERQSETRQAMARALDGAADRAGEDVTRLLEEGDRRAAEARGSALSEAVDRALAGGLSTEEVVGVIAKRYDLMLRIAEERPS